MSLCKRAQVFPKRLTHKGGGGGGRILTIGYCFLELFVGGQGLDRGGQSRDGGSPSPLPTRENPGASFLLRVPKKNLVILPFELGIRYLLNPVKHQSQKAS